MPNSGSALPDSETLSDSQSSSHSEPSSPDDESSSNSYYYVPLDREPVEQLHKRFQHSTTLLHHLQYLNEGHPFIPLGTDIPRANLLLGRRTAVDASASILEMGHEVIAVASFNKLEKSQVVAGGLVCVASTSSNGPIVQDQTGEEMRGTKAMSLKQKFR